MIPKDQLDEMMDEIEREIERNEKEKGKDSTSQIYYGSQPILLTMIASMAQTLVVKNKVFTKEELIEAINLGSQEDESK